MKSSTRILSITLAALFGLCAVHAGDDKSTTVKPYTLDTCVVCDMKFSDMGKPYTFVYQNREIKVCDKSEADEFKKEPAKYLKKIDDAEAKAKK